MRILITGCAGFIGYHICKQLLNDNIFEVFGIDNISDYYDVKLKKSRLRELKKNKKFIFKKLDISKKKQLMNNFQENNYNYVIHLAAQAGVRYSIFKPEVYFNTNIYGFFNILEASRIYKIKHFLFASSSSVYGDSKKFPIKENYNTDKPKSFYAATKKSNEIMAYSYSNIYKLPCTALRFFTVYGPMGRPDMAIFKFTDQVYQNKKIQLYNNGNHKRDFTYISDAVIPVIKLIKKSPKSEVPFIAYNICSSKINNIRKILNIIIKEIKNKKKPIMIGLQKGDVINTHGSNNLLIQTLGNFKNTNIKDGINNFLKWYKNFYN